MTPEEARSRLVTARVDLELLAEWLTKTDRPGADDEVQRDLFSIVDAITVVLAQYREALAIKERVVAWLDNKYVFSSGGTDKQPANDYDSGLTAGYATAQHALEAVLTLAENMPQEEHDDNS